MRSPVRAGARPAPTVGRCGGQAQDLPLRLVAAAGRRETCPYGWPLRRAGARPAPTGWSLRRAGARPAPTGWSLRRAGARPAPTVGRCGGQVRDLPLRVGRCGGQVRDLPLRFGRCGGQVQDLPLRVGRCGGQARGPAPTERAVCPATIDPHSIRDARGWPCRLPPRKSSVVRPWHLPG